MDYTLESDDSFVFAKAHKPCPQHGNVREPKKPLTVYEIDKEYMDKYLISKYGKLPDAGNERLISAYFKTKDKN